MSEPNVLPLRSAVPAADTWDLTQLFPDAAAWDRAFVEAEGLLPKFAEFRGTLGMSAAALVACLEFDEAFDRRCDALGAYAYLRAAEDQGNDLAQRMLGRFRNLATRGAGEASYIRPEIMAVPPEVMERLLADPAIGHYRLVIERILRYRPHTLGDKEEQLLAMQGEMASVSNQVFRQLLDVDLKFGEVTDDSGRRIELTNSNFIVLLRSRNREVRRGAFEAYYREFDAHRHTLAATYQGALQRDAYQARVRGYGGSLDQALFADDVPRAVYENLIATVREHLPLVHRYYRLRRRLLGLTDLHHYDTYVPLVDSVATSHTWDEAVETICESLRPLGTEYVDTLRQGLAGRWCDRYPNQGKQSGAFSYGTYDGPPYILMNYHPTELNDVFTLAHEAGHSMHSWYSRRQPYTYHSYAIFVAEVASTFNERMLNHHLIGRAEDDRLRQLLISNELDDIRATIVRQTMFAEFEMRTHELVDRGEPATVDVLRGIYRELLEAYFGSEFAIDDALSLECLRIPHFYRAFYVYKYATGLSAAIALSERVLGGGKSELDDYLGFLSGGCSKMPLELLKDAGVDMTRPEPIAAAMQRFGEQVEALERLTGSV